MSMDLDEQYDKIYRYCYLKLGHRQTAEDITQETFLRFLEDTGYQNRGKQLAYLYTIARNLCVDHYRKKQTAPYEGEKTDRWEERLVNALTLGKAVGELSWEDQELIFLRYVNEVPIGEMGKILGISRFSVHRRLNSCLTRLKERMEERGFD